MTEAKLKSSEKFDIYLMYPVWFGEYSDQLDAVPDAQVDKLLSSINKMNHSEFDGDFFKNIERSTHGTFKFSGFAGKSELVGKIYLSIHKSTNVGVLNIMFTDVDEHAVNLLEAFGAEYLTVKHEGTEHIVEDWLNSFNITVCGRQKAVVFAHSPFPSEQQVLQILSLESTSCIIGRDLNAFARENIAEYDVATVYASRDCLLEIEKEYSPSLTDRFETQAIELFFVELILLQIASIGHACGNVIDYMSKHSYTSNNNDNRLLLELSEQVYSVTNFMDFNQFRYQTVRSACRRISDRFSVPEEIEKYYKYRAIVEQMINISTGERMRIEESNMSLLLLVLALIQIVPILMSIFEMVYEGKFTIVSLLAWISSLASCFTIYIIFRISRSIQINRALLKK